MVQWVEIMPVSTGSGYTAEHDDDRIRRYWSTAADMFESDNNRLSKVRLHRVRQTASAGGYRTERIADSEFSFETDTAVIAAGFEPCLDGAIVDSLELKSVEGDKPLIDEYMATSVSGVFAAGDLVTGASYIATAISSGRTVADRILNYLQIND
jgi:glutamate synthase (NADPH/NADH) small chain